MVIKCQSTAKKKHCFQIFSSHWRQQRFSSLRRWQRTVAREGPKGVGVGGWRGVNCEGVCPLMSWGLEATLTVTLSFKRSYKISHPPWLSASSKLAKIFKVDLSAFLGIHQIDVEVFWAYFRRNMCISDHTIENLIFEGSYGNVGMIIHSFGSKSFILTTLNSYTLFNFESNKVDSPFLYWIWKLQKNQKDLNCLSSLPYFLEWNIGIIVKWVQEFLMESTETYLSRFLISSKHYGKVDSLEDSNPGVQN